MSMKSTKSEIKNSNDLYEIALIGGQIRNELMVSSTPLTPVNLEEETEKFLKSTKYNPQFVYKKPELKRYDIIIDNLERKAELLDLPDDLFFHIIEYLNHLRLLYHARHSIGRPTFPVYAKLVFNWDILTPEDIIKEIPKTKFEKEDKTQLRNAIEIVNQLQNVIDKRYGIPNFRVRINNFSRNLIFVNFETIDIGKDIKRFQNNVERLIVHEVESHVIQNYNMRTSNNPLRTMSKFSVSELYSEGLAVYNEINTKTITKKSFDNYYFRLKAANHLHLSFRELLEMLIADGLSIKHAFNITYRAKRGMADTSKPGGFPKDSAYLLGYKAVLDYLKHNPERNMYYAKNPNLTNLLLKYNLVGKKKLLIPKFGNK